MGARGSVQVPSDARVIDVAGKTIVPGYVDTHAHLRARGVYREENWSYAANLAYGVTTTRDPQTGTTDVLSYEDMVMKGDVLGPRIYSTGPGVMSSENIRDLEHARRGLELAERKLKELEGFELPSEERELEQARVGAAKGLLEAEQALASLQLSQRITLLEAEQELAQLEHKLAKARKKVEEQAAEDDGDKPEDDAEPV